MKSSLEQQLENHRNRTDADSRKYHKVMDLLRRTRMDHGTCEPRHRQACTACNAKEALETMINEYRGAPVMTQG